MSNRIEKSNFKLIESELYCYLETKKELEQLEEEILEGSAFQEVCVQSSALGDTTANKAVKLISSKAIMECERRIKAIDKTLFILQQDETKLRLLQMKYFERRFSDIGIQQELHISRETFYRWRKEIIKLVGQYLGWRV